MRRIAWPRALRLFVLRTSLMIAVPQCVLGAYIWLVVGTAPYAQIIIGSVALALAGLWLVSKDKTKEESEMNNNCLRCNGPADIRSLSYPYCDSCYYSLRGLAPTTTAIAPSMSNWYAQQSAINRLRATVVGGSLSTFRTTVAPAVEERAEPVYGWRAYRVAKGGVLLGVRAEWEDRSFKATCEEDGVPPEQIKQMLNDDVAYRFWLERRSGSSAQRCVSHLEKGVCSCGVYLRAKPEPMDPKHFIYAKVLAHGVVALDEDGNARASEVQIEALYVVPPEIAPPWDEYMDWERLGNVLRGRYDVPVRVLSSLEDLANP